MSGSKEEPFIQEIMGLHSGGNYRAILDLLQGVFLASLQDKSKVHLLHLISWPTPTEEDLRSLSTLAYGLRVSHIHSIGCGTGLLEWLLGKYLLDHYLNDEAHHPETKIQVTGIETDFRWWTSSYAPPQFIPLQFMGKDWAPENPFGDFEDMVMFCYCNSVPLFQQYVSAFLGTFVLIIGPLSSPVSYDSSSDLVDHPLVDLELPETFKLPKSDWRLVLLKRFGLERSDHVAVYKRIDKMTDFPPSQKIVRSGTRSH